MRKIKSTFLVLACIVYSLNVYPQAGALDNTFGQGGIVTSALEVSGNSSAQAIAIQDDGKFVVAGFADNEQTVMDFALARYNSDGTLDNTFGVNGIIHNGLNYSRDDRAYAVTVQKDGKILAAGTLNNGDNEDFAIARYNSDGSPDNLFGTDGIVISDLTDADETIFALAVQDDGKILAAGRAENETDEDFAVARYLSDGTIDDSFGTDGIITISGGGGSDVIRDMAIQENGKIIVVGESNNGSNYDFSIIRLNVDGTIDRVFDTPQILPGNEFAYSLAIQEDRKVLVCGYTLSKSTSYDLVLVRFLEDGHVDSTFGTNGNVITDIAGGQEQGLSVRPGEEGKIIVAGIANSNGEKDFLIARYNPDGSPDNSFGSAGIQIIPVGSSEDVANAMIVQADGKIVAAGKSHGDTYDKFALTRCNIDGTPDINFGSKGIVSTCIGRSFTHFADMLLQQDDKIVVGENAHIGTNHSFVLSRYNSDGSKDTVFGKTDMGMVILSLKNSDMYSLALQDDGKILAVGRASTGTGDDFALVRYTKNGQPDTSFGNNGFITSDFDSLDDVATSIAIQSNGLIVLAGYSGASYALARYLTDGTLDPTFGNMGLLRTAIKNINDKVHSVVVQPDGKILVAGTSYNGNDHDLVIIRYLEDGTPDPSFGNNGVVLNTLEIQRGNNNWSNAIQDEGKLLVAGHIHNGREYEFCVLRLNSDGTLDDTFGNDGIASASMGKSINAFLTDIAIQQDDKIVTSGYVYSEGIEGITMVIVRFTRSGSLDDTFGQDGMALIPVGNSLYSAAYAVAIQNNGRIVIAGNSSDRDNTYSVISIIRLIDDQTLEINSEFVNSKSGSDILEQNFPNPFSHSTEIRWKNETNGFVTLVVYDVNGKPVETLVNRMMKAGTYQNTFVSKNLSGGIYFYRLSAGNLVETKKLILLK